MFYFWFGIFIKKSFSFVIISSLIKSFLAISPRESLNTSLTSNCVDFLISSFLFR